MRLYFLRAFVWHLAKSVITAFGLFWMLIEPAIGLAHKTINLTYGQLAGISVIGGVIWVIVDGLFITGFLKKSIQIKSNGFDTEITVMFGDLLKIDGWKAVAVNDFFDNIVDELHITSGSLHGKVLKAYWGGNIVDWDRQVERELASADPVLTDRPTGKQYRYQIGSTAAVTKDADKFLFSALTHTDIDTLQVKASASELNRCIRGLLTKARSVCANQSVNIPLMGSGLSRIGIKSNILVDLILTAVFEETKLNKVTDHIRIVLPVDKISEISLVAIKRDWS